MPTWLKHAVKTGLAAALAMLASRWLNLADRGTWAVFTAVVVMQSNLGSSLYASWARLLGTTLGAATGFALASVLPHGPWSIGAAVAVAVAIGGLLNLPDSLRVAGVTAALIMVGSEQAAPLQVGLERFGEVMLGVTVALLVNVAVFPSRAGQNLRAGLAAALRHCGAFYDAVTAAFLSRAPKAADADALRAKMRESRRKNVDLVRDLSREPVGRSADDERSLNLLERVETVQERLFVLEHLVADIVADACYSSLQPYLAALRTATGEAFAALADAQEAGRPPAPPAALTAAVAALDAEYARQRAAGAGRSCSTDELLRFFSLYHTLKEIAGELIAAAASNKSEAPG